MRALAGTRAARSRDPAPLDDGALLVGVAALELRGGALGIEPDDREFRDRRRERAIVEHAEVAEVRAVACVEAQPEITARAQLFQRRPSWIQRMHPIVDEMEPIAMRDGAGRAGQVDLPARLQAAVDRDREAAHAIRASGEQLADERCPRAQLPREPDRQRPQCVGAAIASRFEQRLELAHGIARDQLGGDPLSIALDGCLPALRIGARLAVKQGQMAERASRAIAQRDTDEARGSEFAQCSCVRKLGLDVGTADERRFGVDAVARRARQLDLELLLERSARV